ncbi:MAG: T9SS type A sorting domain-containing protein [Bacteroidetes bacterium]|nr:T9SS type A sorting domain-containing protein [Bacteroidota bacterium]
MKFLDMKRKLLSLAMLTSIENNKTQKIDLNNLNSGVYVVSVLNGANKVILNKKISLNK